jgi:hypothetical protein
MCEQFNVMNWTSYGRRVTSKAPSSIERNVFLSLQVSSHDTLEDVITDLVVFTSSTSSDFIST